jgi:hypothetical protein
MSFQACEGSPKKYPIPVLMRISQVIRGLVNSM